MRAAKPRDGWRLTAATTGLVCAVFAVIAVRTAWLCDDAYITLRTVDNVLAGHGLTWNPAERVQAYTHPLWMGLLVVVCGLTGSFHLAPLLLGLALSGLVVAVVVATATTPGAGLVAGAVLVLSRAHLDYSTSGLENPLAHLLCVGFFVLFLRAGPTPRSLRALALLAGAAALCRLDLLLLLAPALIAAAGRLGGRDAARALAPGLAPLVLWELFSLVYYGSPVPNTAWAKLATGIPPSDRIVQGLSYLANSAIEDRVTLPAVAAALAAATAVDGRPGRLLVAAGMVLYLGYVVAIGGDFMSGRLLSPVLCTAAVALAASRPRRPLLVGTGVAVLALGAWTPEPTPTNDRWYPLRRVVADRPLVDARGIADERGAFFRFTGLLRAEPDAERPDTHPWAREGLAVRRAGVEVAVAGAVGLFGFHAGPGVHVVDRFALADPLLARLPARTDRPLRAGHFERPIPEGYLRSLMRGRTLLAEPAVAACHEDVRALVRGPLWRAARLEAGRRLLVSGCAGVTAPVAAARDVPFASVSAGALAASRPLPLAPGGADLYLDAPRHDARLHLLLSPRESYSLRFHRGARELARTPTRPDPADPGGAPLAPREVRVPPAAAAAGFDRIRVLARDPDARPLLGGIVEEAIAKGAPSSRGSRR